MISVDWANSYNFTQFPNDTNRNLFSLGKTSVVETDNGGCVVAGNVRRGNDINKADVFLSKLDSKGNDVWVKAFSNNSYESSPLIRKVNGGYVLIFISSSFPEGNEEYCLIKFNSDFNVIWERTIKMVKSQDFKVYNFNIIQTLDEGYAILLDNEREGYPGSVIVKVSKSGSMEWERDFKDHIASIDSDTEGITVLTETNLSNLSFSLLKIDEKGDQFSLQSYSLKDYNKTISIKKSSDGGYFILGLGTYEPSKDGSGIVIVNGKEMFKFPDNPDFYEISYSGQDGTMLILRQFEAIGLEGIFPYLDKLPVYGIFVMKLDKDGNKEWVKMFGKSFILPVYFNYFNPILPLDDGDCIVSFTICSPVNIIGDSGSHMALVFKLDKTGNVEFSEAFEGGITYSSISLADQGFIISGVDMLLKFDEEGNIGTGCKNLFRFDIGSKGIATAVKSDGITNSSSVAFTVSPVELEVEALGLPEVSTICGGE
jgi:hypothetical protein